MNKEYIDNMRADAEKSFQEALGKLVDYYRSAPIPDDMRDFILEDINKKLREGEQADFIHGISSRILAIHDFLDMKYLGKRSPEDKEAKERDKDAAWDALETETFEKLGREVVRADSFRRHDFERYQDSEPMEFDGDIIITDPCYIIRHYEGRPEFSDYVKKDSGDLPEVVKANVKKWEDAVAAWEAQHPNEWALVDYGSNMEAVGINHYITRDTIYGDWSCTTYDLDDEEHDYGSFCADAGLVSVFLLDEVLKYNPDFDYHKERDWTTTLIPNFKGKIHVEVERTEWEAEEDTSWCKKGQVFVDYELHIIGHGVDKVTGKPINFKTSQSSL